MAIFLMFPETEATRRAEILRPSGDGRTWFEMPHGWHVSAPDLAPHLVRAVRTGRWNHGRIYSVLAIYPDGSSLRIEAGLDLSDAIALSDTMQRGANMLGNPAGNWYQVRTIENFPIYMTKGGRS